MKFKPTFIVKHRRAWPWMPAFIRNGLPSIFAGGYWIKWGKYTRVCEWNERLNRYKTVRTVLGWQDFADPVTGENYPVQ